MTDTNPPSDTPPSTTETKKKTRHTVVPLPKIVFFYPLMLVCIACAVLESMSAGSKAAGIIFIVVFLINILIISFDFPGVKAVALALGCIALTLGLLYLNTQLNVLEPLRDFANNLFEKVHASSMFYIMVSAILAVMILGGIVANYLWNRWTIEPNRLFHRHGLLGDIREFPVIDLQVEKKIDDVFEYALLLSGTLTFSIPNAPTITLENVPFINRAEKKVQTIVRKR